jgi:hypothetical protein
MAKWLPGLGIFIVLSSLVSYFLEASFVVAPSVVAVLSIFSCIIHHPEKRPGDIDNPDDEPGNPLYLAALLTGVIVLCIAIGHFFPITSELGLYNLLEP